MPVRELQPHDVERILRDVLSGFGLSVSILQTERTPDGWRVTLSDTANRVISTEAPAGSPAAVRAAFTRWADGQL